MSIDTIVVLPPGANEWLAQGERGVSSLAIFTVMTGLNVASGWGLWPPADPSDLRRCELLLRAVPEFRGRLPEMASVSPVWKRLVGTWDELIATMDAESPGWDTGRSGFAPRTYALMRECEKGRVA